MREDGKPKPVIERNQETKCMLVMYSYENESSTTRLIPGNLKLVVEKMIFLIMFSTIASWHYSFSYL